MKACSDKHGGSGSVVAVKMTIDGDGKVKTAVASGGELALQNCVTSAVNRAEFRKTLLGMSFTYPFVFR